MAHVIRIWLTVGGILVVLGLLVFTLVLWRNDWSFHQFSTVQYVTNTHRVQEDFTDIAVQTDTANLSLIPSDSGSCQVVCYEMEAAQHRVTVENGCLTIRMQNERKWYDYIGVFNGAPKITVMLPRQVYQSLAVQSDTGKVDLPGDFTFERIDVTCSTGAIHCLASASESLKLKTSTGRVQVENLSAGTVDIAVSTGGVTGSQVQCTGLMNIRTHTGKVTLTDIACGTLASTGDTGTITLEQVVATDSISIERSTGHVKFDRCDAASLTVNTSTGDVTGSLSSGKVFLAQTDTGRIDVPQTDTGGRCRITTDTGDIKIRIEE